jgi:hypothetical protein
MTQEIVKIKDIMIDKIMNHFIENGVMDAGTFVVLDSNTMKKLCDEVLSELYHDI